ncbi:MAG: aminotransferase class I/II-fold pyridoxal phosphate-dependent enzyme [Acidimicrobiales bacterium]
MSAGRPSRWAARVEEQCRQVEAEGRWRRPRPFDASGPAGVLVEDGRSVVSFASNDYLGLSAHPAVVDAACRATERWGTGAGASRLVTGSRPVHHELEAALADYTGCERAVLFPTGFAANLGVLTTFGDAGVHIFSDELNHASIIDGARLARADVEVYGHGDVAELDARLHRTSGPAIVVTDLVFSMDGDVAPLADIARACRHHGALLVLDEAHAVLGPDPTPDLNGTDVLRVGTLSKTLGALGGFVAGPAPFVDLLENRARSYIFTTAPTPADAAAALAALGVVRSDEGAALRARLSAHVARLAPGHPSPIVPVVLGTEHAALAATAALLEQGLWVPAIRPPTVAVGTARLRVTLSAAHTDVQVDRLCSALDQVRGSASGAGTGDPGAPGIPMAAGHLTP